MGDLCAFPWKRMTARPRPLWVTMQSGCQLYLGPDYWSATPASGWFIHEIDPNGRRTRKRAVATFSDGLERLRAAIEAEGAA